MAELKPIDPKNRRVVNVHNGKFKTFVSNGIKDGEVLQLTMQNHWAQASIYIKWQPAKQLLHILMQAMKNSILLKEKLLIMTEQDTELVILFGYEKEHAIIPILQMGA